MQASEENMAKSLIGKSTAVDKGLPTANLDKLIDEYLRSNELELYRDLLSAIPGVCMEGAVYILSEIGNGMEFFADEQHLSSWVGMSPGNNESAGKKRAHLWGQ
jgi:transposase